MTAVVSALAGCSTSRGDSSAQEDASADVHVLDGPEAPDVDPASRAAAQTACAHRASAYCMKLAACYPALLIALLGDEPSCEAAASIACTPSLLAPGATTSPADIDACANALPSSDCAALFGNNVTPETCRTKPGTLADGARCGFDTQCAGAYCVDESDGCGRCSSRGGSGEKCYDKLDCNDGLVCADSACVAPRGLNEACSARLPCAAQLVCDQGNCTAPLTLDSPCSTGDDLCDATAGLYCGGFSCAAVTFTTTGTCGFVGVDTRVVCAASGACVVETDQRSVCVLPAPYGAPCDEANGPPCTVPARCIGERCTIRTEATCL